MKIAFISMYTDYFSNDNLFKEKTSTLGENLLLPGIKLKEYLVSKGHTVHTLDMYKEEQVDVLICLDIPKSWCFIDNFADKLRYIYHRLWKRDILREHFKTTPRENRILIIQEPPSVHPKSYNRRFHKVFGTVFTWNNKMVDNERYYRLMVPQPIPAPKYTVRFADKKFLTMICGNKKSSDSRELYSRRREVIEFFEKNKRYEFDLYGIGWEGESLQNFKGPIDGKLAVLSRYKYSIAYENMTHINGYITEKIFDCFFAGVVPVYWGADDVCNFIPPECFIDMRNFASIEQMLSFLNAIDEQTYNSYLDAAQRFLASKQFSDVFSVDAYIRILGEKILSLN